MSVRALAAAVASGRRDDDCVIMRLQGELGNQLFQYATGLALARRLGIPLRFDLDKHEPTLAHCIGDDYVGATDAQLWRCAELRDTPTEMWARSLQIRAWLPYRRARHRPERHLQLTDPFILDPRIERMDAPCFVRGYFQHLGYFADVLDEVVKQFASHLFGPDERPAGRQAVVGLHFRRGDYLPRGWELSMAYYEAALAVLEAEVPSARLQIFADDAVFAELMVEHLIQQGRRAELAPDGPVRVHPAVDALVDMARCDHLVIANSTFSWWAGALGDHLVGGADRLVLTPARWRRDPTAARAGARRLASPRGLISGGSRADRLTGCGQLGQRGLGHDVLDPPGGRPRQQRVHVGVVAPQAQQPVRAHHLDRHERQRHRRLVVEVPGLGVLGDDGVALDHDALEVVVEGLDGPEADAQAGRDLSRTGGAAIVDGHVGVEAVEGEHRAHRLEVALDVEGVPEPLGQGPQLVRGEGGHQGTSMKLVKP